MASLFGHAAAGATLAYITGATPRRRLIVLAAVSAVLPDIDAIGFFMGVPYERVWGHRGFTHSILFAAIWGVVVGTWCFPTRRLIASGVLFVATLSHGLLDAMTTGGHGVGFFIPFQNERYFFPWHPIAVSPIGVRRFFTERGLRVIYSELFYIGVPCAAALIAHRLWGRRR